MSTHTSKQAQARGGFAPATDELRPTPLEVSGEIPDWLTGTLVRVVPNLTEHEGRPLMRHWFDGLAMLNGFAISGGEVTLTTRHVDSRVRERAVRTGRWDAMGFATDPCRRLGGRVMSLFEPTVNDNPNVNVVRLGDRCLALTETPLPVEFDERTLETKRLVKFDDKLGGHYTSAHPHLDRGSGELLNLYVHASRKNHYRLTGMPPASDTRRLIADIPVSRPSYMHSFALTERFLILTEIPLTYNLLKIKLRDTSLMDTMRWEPDRGTTFIVIDRASGAVVTRAHTDAFFTFHHANAFEQDGQVVVDLVAWADPSPLWALLPERLQDPEQPIAPLCGTLDRFEIPLSGGAPTRTRLSDERVEFPRINYRHNGQPYRYAYTAAYATTGQRLVRHDRQVRPPPAHHHQLDRPRRLPRRARLRRRTRRAGRGRRRPARGRLRRRHRHLVARGARRGHPHRSRPRPSATTPALQLPPGLLPSLSHRRAARKRPRVPHFCGRATTRLPAALVLAGGSLSDRSTAGARCSSAWPASPRIYTAQVASEAARPATRCACRSPGPSCSPSPGKSDGKPRLELGTPRFSVVWSAIAAMATCSAAGPPRKAATISTVVVALAFAGKRARRWATVRCSLRTRCGRATRVSFHARIPRQAGVGRVGGVRHEGNHWRMSESDLRIPRAMRETARAVTDVTDEVCAAHLDNEYAQIARRLVARLARKRPSPLARGHARIWAGGVLYVAAQANFLFDKSQRPHLTATELAQAAGVKPTTMANKAGMINRLLNIGMFQPELMRVDMIEQHPLSWIVEVDGFLVDARMLPPEVQELARQQGLIPDLDALRAA